MIAPINIPAKAPAPAPIAAPSPPPAIAPIPAPEAAPLTIPTPAPVGTPLPEPIPLLLAALGAEAMSWARYCFTSARIDSRRSSNAWVAARRFASLFSSSPLDRSRAGGGVVDSRTKMDSSAGIREKGSRSASRATHRPEV